MRAGPLTAELDGADLRSVRWGNLEIASRIQVTVRDERWGTLRPTVRHAGVVQRPDGFAVTLDTDHGDGAFAWRGTLEGRSDGTLTFAIDGIAERDFVYRRIGICVEHPWAPYVGARYKASGAGHGTEGTFQQDIAPQLLVGGMLQPLIPSFVQLAVAFPGGVHTTFAFGGEPEGYELEDQRNWTDASFKSYPTPLRSSQPRTLRRGERLRQRLEVRVEGPATSSVDDHGPVRVELGSPSSRVMPDVGVSMPRGSADVAALLDLQPAHLRVVLPTPDETSESLRGAVTLARAAAVPLELVCLLDEHPAPSLGLDASLKRVMLLRRDGATTDGELVAEARARLGRDGVPICGGTSSHFSELNRRNPNPSGMDAIALALTPQMHAIDERSMVSSLEIQAQIVTRVREMTGDLPVVVSRVTLASHEGIGDDHGTPDERVGSAFGAAWTVGSVASLAAAGAAAVTVHEAVDRTILTSEALSRAVRELTSRRGLPLDLVASSDPRRVVAIAAAGTPILLANLTPDTQEAALDGTMVERRSLGPYELASLERSPR